MFPTPIATVSANSTARKPSTHSKSSLKTTQSPLTTVSESITASSTSLPNTTFSRLFTPNLLRRTTAREHSTYSKSIVNSTRPPFTTAPDYIIPISTSLQSKNVSRPPKTNFSSPLTINKNKTLLFFTTSTFPLVFSNNTDSSILPYQRNISTETETNTVIDEQTTPFLSSFRIYAVSVVFATILLVCLIIFLADFRIRVQVRSWFREICIACGIQERQVSSFYELSVLQEEFEICLSDDSTSVCEVESDF